MPIPSHLLALYPEDWPLISQYVRFKRAKGRCEVCDRPHGGIIVQLPAGEWFDESGMCWRNDAGQEVLLEKGDALVGATLKLVILATAHLDHDPTNNDPRNLAALCGRCHLRHDAIYHKYQRAMHRRKKRAVGDLFDGLYASTLTELSKVA